MSITDEIKEYFSSLLAPLANQEAINEMFDNFKKAVLSKLEQRIEEQNERIEKLESTLAIQQNVGEKLTIQCDNNEQYSRRIA